MNRFFAIAILVIGASTMASASKVSDRAHAVIRLKVASDGYNGVDFKSTRESRMAGDEVRVTGNGTAYDKKSRDSRDFDYSVIVNSKDMRAKNVEVRYKGGGSKPIPPTGESGSSLRFESPRANQTLRSTQVDFRGRATGRSNVTVKVYDDRGNKVAEKSTMPRNNEWSLEIFVKEEGRFRAVASHDRRETEVRFRVDKDGNWEGGGNGGGDWGSGTGSGWNSHNIQINTPSDGGQVSGSRIRFEGSALRTSRVRIRVYRGGGGALFNETRAVRNGQWECEVPLARGTYRIQVTADGDDRDLGKTISFTVR